MSLPGFNCVLHDASPEPVHSWEKPYWPPASGGLLYHFDYDLAVVGVYFARVGPGVEDAGEFLQGSIG